MNVNAKHILASYASAGMASFCLCRPKAKYIYFHHEFFNVISTISLDQKHFEP